MTGMHLLITPDNGTTIYRADAFVLYITFLLVDKKVAAIDSSKINGMHVSYFNVADHRAIAEGRYNFVKIDDFRWHLFFSGLFDYTILFRKYLAGEWDAYSREVEIPGIESFSFLFADQFHNFSLHNYVSEKQSRMNGIVLNWYHLMVAEIQTCMRELPSDDPYKTGIERVFYRRKDYLATIEGFHTAFVYISVGCSSLGRVNVGVSFFGGKGNWNAKIRSKIDEHRIVVESQESGCDWLAIYEKRPEENSFWKLLNGEDIDERFDTVISYD